jgi:hypothetical protein
MYSLTTASNPVVGSSMINISLSPIKAKAIESLLLKPPLRVLAY